MIDVLGHPIIKGAKVLTSHYSSPNMNYVTTVKKVNKKTVVVKLPVLRWNNFSWESDWRDVKRTPDKVVVITNQLAYNKKQYPEYIL
jgi:hypothetical protein